MIPSFSNEPLPQVWLEKIWDPETLSMLLANGFIPSLNYSELSKAANRLPNKYAALSLPEKEIWDRCWSLPSINLIKQEELEYIWESTS